MSMRQCPYCGKNVTEARTECPFCHAMLPEIQVIHHRDNHADTEIRKGLLYVLLAAVINYFAGGYSALQVPYPIQPIVTTYLSPLLLLGGLGLTLHGFYLQRKAWSHTVRYR
jgi:ABC-type thiamin/hydroxymethylpyrimidine transport system permease subunit